MSQRTTDRDAGVVSPLLQQVLDYRQAVEREREAENFHPDAQALFPFMLAVARLAARANSRGNSHD